MILQKFLETNNLVLPESLSAEVEKIWAKIDWKKSESIKNASAKIQELLQNSKQTYQLHKSQEGVKDEEKESKDEVKKDSEKDLDIEEEGAPEQGLKLRPVLLNGKKLPEKIASQEELEKLIQDLPQNTEFTVVSVQKKNESIKTRPPFTTSTLQQAASNTLGLAPSNTMRLAQTLYEEGYITYMRTDSLNLSQEAIDASRQYLQKNYPQFLPPKPKKYLSKSKNAQEAHEAIRPTNVLVLPSEVMKKVETKMGKLYDLIWRQTVACQMTDQILERLTFELENAQKSRFSGSTAWTISLGWKALSQEKETAETKETEKNLKAQWLQELAKI